MTSKMRSSVFVVLCLIMVAAHAWPLSTGAPEEDVLMEDKEERAIRDAVEQKYIAGILTRDFSLIEEVCIPDAKLMGTNKEGALRTTTLKQWSKRFDPEKPPFQELSFIISRVDRVGTIAQVRVDFEVDSTQHATDFLNMVKVDGAWRVVNIVDY